MSEVDERHMIRALTLAAQAIGLSDPNPRVGCVLVSADGGQVLGEGHTQAAGGPHAEIVALQDAAARGNGTRGATAYVTLEPCSHQGRTGPCCDALIAAGVARVVASAVDPNPLVRGRGLERLRSAGLHVTVGPGEAATRELNIGFFHRMEHGRPWVRMKVAASLDGVTALDNGASRWITSPEARVDGHAWRARAGAILTGIGTVLADNPRLDVRAVATTRQPDLVLVDSRLQLPADAALFLPGRQLLVATAVRDPAREAALEARGASLLHLPGPGAKVDLGALVEVLAERQVNELHVEAGHKLNGSLLRAGLVNELLLYLAPSLLGQGQPVAALGPLTDLVGGIQLAFDDIAQVGPDLRVRARVVAKPASPLNAGG
ncbi:MAG: Diaminohydroxyphosphoribosylaminopyrimidine deaminase / 5-amino-6-(5-phosphoribosylamino)uracil reductase [uncultured Ramlibacter sp.]|uniref:Riboflavin biosynthesis protein RibD n=1 Tax=uncultured Ramlibacter sp. TaxID=260755 RepID=A0A6J4P7P9_9BURK|nr:MAG: Diaminohydroxyphosphoribosylaminopyrimidine deaminase / 5-amino-6-(5-phosphoribosylamino)uracil reductase [uncultured Ramlibacter sp.]